VNVLSKILYLSFILLFILCPLSVAQPNVPPIPVPKISVGVTPATKPGDLAVTLEILLLLTVLSLLPSILVMLTSYTRIIVVFAFLREGLGTRQTPPNQVLIGLALFLTLFIMQPVWTNIYNDAVKPYFDNKISYQQAYDNALKPIRSFMFKEVESHHNEDDITLFLRSAHINKVESRDDIPTSVIIPAFIVSELEIAFKIGILLFIPFIVIDMVVASILLSMGMIMIPPIMISLPFKVLLFVLVDGWNLLIGGILKGF